MAHMVKCSVCEQMFNRDLVQAVRTGARRYAHATCDKENTDFVPLVQKPEEDSDLKELKDYINKVYGNKANWPIINKQIKKYTKENQFSITGILKTLKYIYEIKKMDTDKSNGGIGLVEFLYQESYNYYLGMFLAQQAAAASKLSNESKEITINPQISKGLKKKFFNIEDYTDEE